MIVLISNLYQCSNVLRVNIISSRNLAPSWHHLPYSAWLAAAGGGPGATAAEAGAWPWFGIWMIGNVQVNALWSCVDRSSLIMFDQFDQFAQFAQFATFDHALTFEMLECKEPSLRLPLDQVLRHMHQRSGNFMDSIVSMLFRFGGTILVVLVRVVLGAWCICKKTWCILQKDVLHAEASVGSVQIRGSWIIWGGASTFWLSTAMWQNFQVERLWCFVLKLIDTIWTTPALHKVVFTHGVVIVPGAIRAFADENVRDWAPCFVPELNCFLKTEPACDLIKVKAAFNCALNSPVHAAAWTCRNKSMALNFEHHWP